MNILSGSKKFSWGQRNIRQYRKMSEIILKKNTLSYSFIVDIAVNFLVAILKKINKKVYTNKWNINENENQKSENNHRLIRSSVSLAPDVRTLKTAFEVLSVFVNRKTKC